MKIRNESVLVEWGVLIYVDWLKILWKQYSPLPEHDKRIQGGLCPWPLRHGFGAYPLVLEALTGVDQKHRISPLEFGGVCLMLSSRCGWPWKGLELGFTELTEQVWELFYCPLGPWRNVWWSWVGNPFLYNLGVRLWGAGRSHHLRFLWQFLQVVCNTPPMPESPYKDDEFFIEFIILASNFFFPLRLAPERILEQLWWGVIWREVIIPSLAKQLIANQFLLPSE